TGPHALSAPRERAGPGNGPPLEGARRVREARARVEAPRCAAGAPLRPRGAPVRASPRGLARALARRALRGGAELRAQARRLEEELLAPVSAPSPREAPPGGDQPRRAAADRHPARRGRAQARAGAG